MKKYWLLLVLGLLVPLLLWLFWPNPNDFAGHGFLETIFANNLLVAFTRTVFVLVTCFVGYSIIVQVKDGKVLIRLWEMGERKEAEKTLLGELAKKDRMILRILGDNRRLQNQLKLQRDLKQKARELIERHKTQQRMNVEKQQEKE